MINDDKVYSLNDFKQYFNNGPENTYIGLKLISHYVPICKMNAEELQQFKYDFGGIGTRYYNHGLNSSAYSKIYLKINKRATKLKIKLKQWWQMNLKES